MRRLEETGTLTGNTGKNKTSIPVQVETKIVKPKIRTKVKNTPIQKKVLKSRTISIKVKQKDSMKRLLMLKGTTGKVLGKIGKILIFNQYVI